MAAAPRRRPRRRLRLVVLVAAAAVVAFLYYRPLSAYLDRQQQLAGRRAELRRLETQNRLLRQRLAGATGDAALVRNARRLGFVKPGERLFIVKGIETWRRRHAPRP